LRDEINRIFLKGLRKLATGSEGKLKNLFPNWSKIFCLQMKNTGLPRNFVPVHHYPMFPGDIIDTVYFALPTSGLEIH